MKLLPCLLPVAAVVLPALAIERCSETCVNEAVAATGCLASNVECLCDAPIFLESVFECSTECGSDEDAAIDTAEDYCGALYKWSSGSDIEARAVSPHRQALRNAMTAIHKIRGELKRTSGRAARMVLFRKLRRARGNLNKIWRDGKKHKGWGRKLTRPPRPAHPTRPGQSPPTPTKPTDTGGPTQTVAP